MLTESFIYDSQCIQPEQEYQDPVTSFVYWYRERTRADAHLLNHETYVTYTSDAIDVDERSAALKEYLTDLPPPQDHSWGRSLFAEVVIEELLREKLMKKMLREQNLTLVASPTSIDHSLYDVGGLFYQKGADLFLVDAKTDIPQAGIDVTTGGSVCIRHKRRQIGLQALVAMPVIVTPLSHLPMPGGTLFDSFIDEIARDKVIHTGDLSWIEKESFSDTTRTAIKNTLLEGVRHCKPGLKSPELRDYPWLSDATDKLDRIEKLVKEYM